jgi:hypothetical protein
LTRQTTGLLYIMCGDHLVLDMAQQAIEHPRSRWHLTLIRLVVCGFEIHRGTVKEQLELAPPNLAGIELGAELLRQCSHNTVFQHSISSWQHRFAQYRTMTIVSAC